MPSARWRIAQDDSPRVRLAVDPTQLDIFADSRDTMLRNDVLRALEERDAPRAGATLHELRAECPHDAAIDPFAVLAAALRTETAPLAAHDALAHELRSLSGVIEPAALAAFGQPSAAEWMVPLWRALAQRCAHLAFDSSQADCHAAPLWLRAGEWANAAGAVSGIESWRRIPVPLGWMAQARHRLNGLDAAWPLLIELAWLAPARFDATSAWIADPVLNKLRKKFGAEFDGAGGVADLAWFPAWALVDDNRLAPVLADAQPSLHELPEQTMRAVGNLLHLERRGSHHELINGRKRLRDLHSGLYAAYMSTR